MLYRGNVIQQVESTKKAIFSCQMRPLTSFLDGRMRSVFFRPSVPGPSVEMQYFNNFLDENRDMLFCLCINEVTPYVQIQ